MRKKYKMTGYQLMAREFARYFKYGENNEQKGEHGGMEFFNQQAGIPDGWDVVKEIYLSLNNMQCHNAGTLSLKSKLKRKLEEGGFEAGDCVSGMLTEEKIEKHCHNCENFTTDPRFPDAPFCDNPTINGESYTRFLEEENCPEGVERQ